MRSDTSDSGPIHRAAEEGSRQCCRDVVPHEVVPSAENAAAAVARRDRRGLSCHRRRRGKTRQLRTRRTRKACAIHTIAIARAGTMLASSDTAGIVRLWHPENRRTRVLSGERAHALCVAFSPDGTTLAVGDSKSKVSIWDVTSGEKKWSVAERSGWVGALAFSPDGTTLASGGGDKCVYLWDVASRQLKAAPRRAYRRGNGGRVCTRRPGSGVGQSGRFDPVLGSCHEPLAPADPAALGSARFDRPLRAVLTRPKSPRLYVPSRSVRATQRRGDRPRIRKLVRARGIDDLIGLCSRRCDLGHR